MSFKSNSSNSYHKESNSYDRKIVDKLQESSKNDMNIICNKYRFNYDLVRLLVELEFDPDIYCKLKINRILHNYDSYGE